MADTAPTPAPAPGTKPEQMTPQEFRAAQVADWGTYIARDDITYNGVLAFSKGSPVPASWLATNAGHDDQVAKVDNKDGQAVLKEVEAARTDTVIVQDTAPVSLNATIK